MSLLLEPPTPFLTSLADLDAHIDAELARERDHAQIDSVGALEDIGGAVCRCLLSQTAWAFTQSDFDVVVMLGPRREGKALRSDALVLTPAGWVKIGDLSVGDRVVSANGGSTAVLGVYPQGVKPLWRLRFNDGTSTVCTDDHLWAVHTGWTRSGGADTDDRVRGASNRKRRRPARRSGEPKVVTTREIRERLEGGAWAHGGRWSIPTVGRVQFPARRVPLDPYVLGVLLGDGGITQGAVNLTSADPELVDEVARLLPLGAEVRARQEKYAYAIVGRARAGSHVVNPVLNALRGLGLQGHGSHTKFVPAEYLWNDIPTRHALLQGLLDTDGTVTKAQRSVSFSSTSEALIEAVEFLVRSLGGLTRRSRVKVGYRVVVRLPEGIAPFRLRRKAERLDVSKAWRQGLHRRFIVGIDPEPEDEAVCIKVADPAGLFVTEDFVVTHNTVAGVARLIRIARSYPRAQPINVAVVRDTWTNLQRTTIKTIRDGHREGWWDAQFLHSDTECILNGGEVHIFFFGMDRDADANKFLGFEVAIVWIEEPAPAADLATGVPANVFAMSVTSLSQKGVKPSVQITSNPPDSDHWLVNLVDYLAEMGHPQMRVEMFRVASGTNRHVPEGYRARMRLGLEAMGRQDLVRRLVDGEIGDVRVGEPVTPGFSEVHHVPKDPIEIRLAFPTYRFWDFGLNPTCVWAQTTPMGHLNVIGVVVGQNMGVKELIQQHVLPWQQLYGLNRARQSLRLGRGAARGVEIRDIGDPAGSTREQSSSEESARKVLEELLQTSFEPGPVSWAARRDSLHAVLTQMVGARPKVQIDPDCYPLIKALRGAWRYHKTPSGKVSDQPIKDVHSHPGDAFGYGVATLWPAHETLRKLLRDEPIRVALPQPSSFMGV